MSRSRKKTLQINLEEKSRKISYKKYINKIIQLKIPNNRNIKWAWLIEINKKDGYKVRYKVRYPKKNLLINDLYKNNKDFGPAKLAPKGSTIFTSNKQKEGAFKRLTSNIGEKTICRWEAQEAGGGVQAWWCILTTTSFLNHNTHYNHTLICQV